MLTKEPQPQGTAECRGQWTPVKQAPYPITSTPEGSGMGVGTAIVPRGPRGSEEPRPALQEEGGSQESPASKTKGSRWKQQRRSFQKEGHTNQSISLKLARTLQPPLEPKITHLDTGGAQ